LLTLDRIYYEYDRRPILDGISLTLAPGKIICLTGPSGCGKTTLLRIAAGLMSPTAGIVNNRFACTAYVFQEPRLLPWQTTQENIAFGLKARGIPKSQCDRISKQLAQQLGLKQYLYHYPHQLSGGMQQRVALGRALAINPDLLLLDEPFNGLDVGRRREFQEILLQLLSDRKQFYPTAQPLAVGIVSHDLAEAVRLGDQIVVMSPNPSQIVYRWQQKRPYADRDEAYIHHTVSQLLIHPQVAKCFGLGHVNGVPME
jgi:NitT/TauT family transport system ATP-binding protein